MNKQELLNELREEGFSDKILDAFEKVPREEFVSEELKELAYENIPLPIGYEQTISQPYTIAFMLNLLELDKINDINDNTNNITDVTEKNKISKGIKFERGREDINNKKPQILEIGSGCGYGLTLLNEICVNCEIFGIERIKELVEASKRRLKNNKNIKVIHGNGSKGISEKKFDRILVSASADKVPSLLIEQLADNGILVIPIRNSILQIRKMNGKIIKKEYPGFVFVPLIDKDDKE